MELSGNQSISAPRPAVWTALNDPAVLRQCIPGCKSLEPEGENAYAATVEVKVGPIGTTFRAAVRLEDLDPPAGYRIVGEGNGGMAGHARGSARVDLAAQGTSTQLTYTVNAEVGGRLAQLGGAIIDATARRLADQFFTRFEQVVTGRTGSQVPASPLADTPATGRGAPSSTAASGRPWGWFVALLAVALAAYLIGGGTFSQGRDGALLVGALLLILAMASGFELGRRR